MRQKRRRGRLVIIACFLALLGLGAIAAWFFMPPLITLRVATGPMGSDGQRFFAAFVRSAVDEHPRVRLQAVVLADVAASAQALEAGEVDLAIVRSDFPASVHGQTIAILRRDVVGLIVPPHSPIENVGTLAGKTVGMVQGLAQDALILDKIFGHYQTPGKTLQRLVLTPDEIGPAIRRKRVAALFVLGPLGPGPFADAVTAMAKAGKGTPEIVAIEAAEIIAQRFPGLEAAEIAPGAFGGTPPRPQDSVATLAVTMRLVARPSLPNYVAGEIARLLFTTKSKLVATLPRASQIEAPDTDKGAALPVHPGAAAYFDGEQTSLFERFESVFYLGMIAVSLLGSGCAWILTAWRGPSQEQQQLQRLMAIFREAAVVGQHRLDALDKEVDQLWAWSLERAVDEDMEAEQFNMFAIVVSQVRQAIDKQRALLQGQHP